MIESFTDVDIAVLQKMIFIYNAMMAGWVIEKVGTMEVSFTRKHDMRTINLQQFVHGNLKIPDDWQSMLKK